MDDSTADSTTVERESSLLARENAKLRQNCVDLTAQLAALQKELKNGVGASEFAAFREAATASERRAESATRDAQASDARAAQLEERCAALEGELESAAAARADLEEELAELRDAANA